MRLKVIPPFLKLQFMPYLLSYLTCSLVVCSGNIIITRYFECELIIYWNIQVRHRWYCQPDQPDDPDEFLISSLWRASLSMLNMLNIFKGNV